MNILLSISKRAKSLYKRTLNLQINPVEFQLKIYFLVVTAVVILLLSQLPYFNLVLTIPSIIFIITITAVFVLEFDNRIIFLYAIASALFSVLLLLLNETEFVETAGNLTFGYLVMGVIIQSIRQIRHLRV